VDLEEKAKGVLFLRHPHQSPPNWESNFAKSGWPDAKTMAGLAKEHARLSAEARMYACAEIRGNAKLAKLARENLRNLFPDIGFNETTGEPLLRLRKGGRSVLQIFDPLGIGDRIRLIRLLIEPPQNYAFYW
jgi:hypothetical protein